MHPGSDHIQIKDAPDRLRTNSYVFNDILCKHHLSMCYENKRYINKAQLLSILIIINIHNT